MASSKSLLRGQFPACCKLCEVETKISWKCMDCDILMCSRCKERRHSTIRNAENHKVVDVKDIGPHTLQLEFSSIKCKNHTTQVCCMFCKSCDQLVYPQCISKIHNGHGLVEVSEGYRAKIQNLNDTNQNQLQNAVDEMTEKEYKIKEIKKVEYAKYMETKTKIQDHDASLRKTMTLFTETLMKELDQRWATFQDSIENEERSLYELKKDTIEKKNRTEEIINSKDVGKVFDEIKAIENYSSQVERPKELQFSSMPTFVTGEISRYNVGSLQHTSGTTLQVIKEYTSNITRVYFMYPCTDALWISDSAVIQKVQPELTNLKVISSFDMKIFDMTVTQSGDIYIIDGGSVIKTMNANTGELINSNYDTHPLIPTAIHFTSDNSAVVGVYKDFKESKGALFIMDMEGKCKMKCEYDKNNRPTFTYPKKITSTENGNIFVVDEFSKDHRGRVVVFGHDGDVLNIYNGHPDINNDEKTFKPNSVAAIVSDIVIPNMGNGILHVLNSEGYLKSYIAMRQFGVEYPFSTVFASNGKVYIGCSSGKASTSPNAKLYEVKLSEVPSITI